MVLGKLFAGLRKTRERLSAGLARVLGAGRQLDEELIADLEEALYTADLGPTGGELVSELQDAYRRRELRETGAPAAGAVSARGESSRRGRPPLVPPAPPAAPGGRRAGSAAPTPAARAPPPDP